MPAPSAESQAPKGERSLFWPIVVGWVVLIFVGALCAVLFQRARHERHLRGVVAELDRTDPGWKLEEIEADRAVIPVKENSARVVVDAHKLLPRGWPPVALSGAPFEDLGPNEQLPPEAFALLKAELDKAGPALATARPLADLRRGRHRIEHNRNPFATLLQDQQDTRAVAALLVYDARRRALEGDLKAALVSCRAALNAGRSLGDEPYLISQLIRIACVDTACREVERVLAQGEPPDEELAALQELLADEEKHPALEVAMRGERASLHKVFEAIKSGEISLDHLAGLGPGGGGEVEWFHALAGEDVHVEHARVLSLMTRWVEDTRLPVPEQVKAERAFEAEVRALPRSAVLTRLVLPATSKVAEADHRRRARLRCLVAAIACERYRQAKGEWPAGLADLGPKFLDPVPADPYDGKPLRLAQVADGLAVYSVGPDGSDDGGKFNRRDPNQPGTDLGFRLWDVPARRQPPPADPVPPPE